jgi:hypothetical protein
MPRYLEGSSRSCGYGVSRGIGNSPSRLSRTLSVTSAPDPIKTTNKMIPKIMVDGWANAGAIDTTIEEAVRRGGRPASCMDPDFQALWAPFVPFPPSPRRSRSETNKLP